MPDSDWTIDQFKSAIHSGGIALWSWHPRSRAVVLDDLACRYWGVTAPEQTLDSIFERIDPRDRDSAREAWLDSAHSPGPYDFAFRIETPERLRWIAARGEGLDSNLDDGTVVAVFVDITAQKEAEEAQRLMVREMVHRIGNLFGVASSLTSLVARTAPDVEALASDLRLRFSELKAGFTYAIKENGGPMQPVPLATVLRELTRPHGAAGDRIAIDVPEGLKLQADSITNLAMIVHELAVNAVKHGALGAEGGHVDLTIRPDAGHMVFDWAEQGGPPLDTLPTHEGFGTGLLDHIIRSSFSGDITRSLHQGGLHIRITMDARFFVDHARS